jgi:Na+/phosphate symporter
MHITLDINLLVIVTLIGGLILLFRPKLLERIKLLRYMIGSGLSMLGVMNLFGIHVVIIN